MRYTDDQVAVIQAANQALEQAGIPSINMMLGTQASAVQKALERVLQIQVRNVYGVPTAYPANEAAELFANIAGTKTLKPETLAYAERLGYRIEQVAQAPFYRSAA